MPLAPLLLVASLARCPAPAATADTLPAARTALDSLWRTGSAFRPFLAGVRARRDEWRASTDGAHADATLVARGRTVGGTWRLLVVAADACGDSMRAVPVLAALDDSLPNVELRIVSPAAARAVQEANRAWDGRIATPTILLLDAQGRQAGCIVERPRHLRHTQRAMVAWWRTDRGTSIAAEAVELLESAAEGIPLCERGQTPPS